MIDKISYEFVKKLSENIDFFDYWSGLVRPMRKKVGNADKVFPVAINTPENCDINDYKALVPNDTKMSIAYIEMLSAPSVEILRHTSKQMTAQLRLVVWYNLDKITSGAYVSEDMLVDNVLDVMPHRLADSLFQGVMQVHIEPTNILYGADIVSKYTYNEIKTQFATHPYGLFAIDLDVWYISFHCQLPIDIEEGCVTGKGNHETLPEQEPVKNLNDNQS